MKMPRIFLTSISSAGTSAIKASEHGLEAFPAHMLIVLPDQTRVTAYMAKVVREVKGPNVFAVIYEADVDGERLEISVFNG